MKNDFIHFIMIFIEMIIIGSIGLILINYIEEHVISFAYLLDNAVLILSAGLIGTIIFYLRYCARHNNDEK
ncbi:MAG: hypothetical protein MJ010_00430 [Paludibacteraceae bacterium]|nr:hypothetical protein [Paludibacteraceae bacterium]